MVTKRKYKARTKRVAPRRKAADFSKVHHFFRQRGIKEGYMVVRIDDYGTKSTCNANGDYYKPIGVDPQRGNTLWPTRAQAVHAAQWAVNRWPARFYAVMRFDTIVMQIKPVINIDVVKV